MCSNDSCLVTDNDISDLHKDLCAEGVSLVAGLRANSSVPFSVIPPIVQSFNNMSGSLISLVQAETVNCLVSSGIDSTNLCSLIS